MTVMETDAGREDGLIIEASDGEWSIAGAEPVQVDPELAAEIAEAARRLAAEHDGPDDMDAIDDHELLVKAEVALRQAPPELLSALVRFRVTGSRDGVLLLRGLPLDDPLPRTPSSGAFHGSWRELGVSTMSQVMMMSCLGDVISYEDEKDGRLVQDICPLKGAETRQENTGSCLLELHTEDGFHPHKPAFISLLCLRSDHERRALTVSAGIRAVLPLLRPEHVQALREPWYRIRMSSSFVGVGRAVWSPPMPVLSGCPSDPDLCVDFHAMEPMTEAGREAFEELRSLMIQSLVGVVLEPGDMLIVDNRKAVHGRTDFMPRYDGEDRWLRRCFAVPDIRTARPMLNDESRVHRPLTPEEDLVAV